MDKNDDIQQIFFQQVKELLPVHLSLVDEVADILRVSNDSAYRRIRGETSLTFDEIGALSLHYGISVDALTNSASDVVAFKYRALDEDKFSFAEYLESILHDLDVTDAHDEKEIVFITTEIPFFHLFFTPEIAFFKVFVWMKSILSYSEFADKKFSLDEIDENIREIAVQMKQKYINIPSIEIFHEGTIDTTLRQIEYYWISGLFKGKKDALIMCDKLSELMKHIQTEAEVGFKFDYSKGSRPPEKMHLVREGNYKLYYNEIFYIDYAVLVKMGDAQVAYIIHNTLNMLMTTNKNFYDDLHKSMSNLLKKSTLISGTSEKERNRIFMNYQEKISALKNRIS